MKKLMVFLLLTACLLPFARAEETVCEYRSETLNYTISRYEWREAVCFATRVSMASPGEQIGKSSADFGVSLSLPSELAKNAGREVALAINGSGFINRTFPYIPPEYPGVSSDYFEQPWGTLTVIHGETKRQLDGLMFTGLTLQEDGLHMHAREPVEAVLAQHPLETWSFYDYAVVIAEGENMIDPDIPFNAATNTRNILCKMEENEYLIVTITVKGARYGLTMIEAAEMIQELFAPEWAFNLDGDGSFALLYKNARGEKLTALVGNRTKVADIVYFCEK